ncbi:MAG: disulfide bond formation protein B [Gammaproteobacteria bacterium]
MKSPRPYYLLLFAVCVSLLGFGYYLQFVDGLEPCPLCIFQRLAYIAVAITALFGFIHAPQNYWIRLYSGLISVTAIGGAGIAGRQVWLQHLPADKVPECGPGLDYMLQVLPLTDTLKRVFTGSGECAQIDWTFLSLSIAEWSLLCFVGLAAASIIHFMTGRLAGGT